MMEQMSGWLSSVVAVSLLVFLLRQILPEGSLRGIGEFTGGLVLLAALLQPLKGMVPEKIAAEAFAWQEEIYEVQEELEKQHHQALSDGIAEAAASYIWDKGNDLGLQLDAAAETRETSGGIPVPWSVTVEGEFSQEMAAWIAKELGIPRERQVWHEGEN